MQTYIVYHNRYTIQVGKDGNQTASRRPLYSADFTISIFTMRAMCSSKLSTICILTFVTLETMAMTIREEYQGGKKLWPQRIFEPSSKAAVGEVRLLLHHRMYVLCYTIPLGVRDFRCVTCVSAWTEDQRAAFGLFAGFAAAKPWLLQSALGSRRVQTCKTWQVPRCNKSRWTCPHPKRPSSPPCSTTTTSIRKTQIMPWISVSKRLHRSTPGSRCHPVWPCCLSSRQPLTSWLWKGWRTQLLVAIISRNLSAYWAMQAHKDKAWTLPPR